MPLMVARPSQKPRQAADLPGQAQDAGDAASVALQAQFVDCFLVLPIGQFTPRQVLQHCLLVVGFFAWHLQRREKSDEPLIVASILFTVFFIEFLGRKTRFSYFEILHNISCFGKIIKRK